MLELKEGQKVKVGSQECQVKRCMDYVNNQEVLLAVPKNDKGKFEGNGGWTLDLVSGIIV
jgi:hypothetical protein